MPAGPSPACGPHYDWLALAFPAARTAGSSKGGPTALFAAAFLGGPLPPAASRPAAAAARARGAGPRPPDFASLIFPSVSPSEPFWGPPGSNWAPPPNVGKRQPVQPPRSPAAARARGGAAGAPPTPGAGPGLPAAPAAAPSQRGRAYSRAELQGLRVKDAARCALSLDFYCHCANTQGISAATGAMLACATSRVVLPRRPTLNGSSHARKILPAACRPPTSGERWKPHRSSAARRRPQRGSAQQLQRRTRLRQAARRRLPAASPRLCRWLQRGRRLLLPRRHNLRRRCFLRSSRLAALRELLRY